MMKYLPPIDKDAAKNTIIQLGTTYSLVSKFTSFVAVLKGNQHTEKTMVTA